MFLSDFQTDVTAFLRQYALWICLGLILIILLVLLFVFLVPYLKKKKSEKANSPLNVEPNEWVNALGGKENIIELSAMGSRLSVSVNNASLLDENKLKELGVTSIMSMSNKVTLVVEDQAEKIKEKLEKSL